MIGKITTGASFYHCLAYCLEDKKNLSDEQKIILSESDHLHHKDRAEVLFYNSCFGTALELAKQFKEVRQLSSRVEKPVLHISLRLAPGETLTKDRLTEIGRACAEEFKFDKNQYICILHKDTRDQHIHIVANRVGYNGRAVNLSNNYLRMANFCRKMELKHELQQVLSPRIFLSKEEKLIPRQDARKEKLKTLIRETLKTATSYANFEQKMKSLGYQVLKGRGISFIDEKKVKVKGSEVGFSLMKIENILDLNKQINIQKEARKMLHELRSKKPANPVTSTQKPMMKKSWEAEPSESILKSLEGKRNSLLYDLMKPEHTTDYIHPELLKEARGKRKKLQHGL